MDNICKICGNDFESARKNTLCSEICKKERQRRYMKKYSKEYYSTPEGLERKRAGALKWQHKHNMEKYDGFGVDEYNALKKEQSNNCAICGRNEKEFKRRLHLDHCHTTGKVRGLLCSNCNTAIGLLKDDIDVIASAISYLQQ
jgi:hypothetical protein